MEITDISMKEIISKLTLEEKCYLLSGKDFWQSRSVKRLGIPSMSMSDGPHGLRKQEGEGDQLGIHGSVPATCFPTAATIANSWNEKLGEQIGICLGKEAVAQDVQVVLGPGLNMKRSPLCGRNFEYFSEDPYLAGKMAAAYIKGIQSQGVSACPKHFAVNSQETRRMASDSVVDERTLREIYLTGFEMAVKESDPHSIMSSYNQVNGVYANENEHLLQRILRDEWGFKGFVVSDWGASNDHVEGVRAGSNLEMPTTGGDSDRELIQAVQEGRISEELIDQRVEELLTIVEKTHNPVQGDCKNSFNQEEHHMLASKAAEESIVLLKNVDHILPISQDKKIAVIGDFAKTPRYQGAGSSMVNPTKLDSTLDVIKDFPIQMLGFEQGYKRAGKIDETLEKNAVELARKADVVLLYIGLDEISETEGLDRLHMKLPLNQIHLIQEIEKVNQEIIVILSGGSVVEMPWINSCKAILHGYLGGQAGASAMLKAVIGEINPSGKLSETYPYQYEDTPAYQYFLSPERNAEHREGLYIGYRYYDTVELPVRFPFGYGLSYTNFEYSDIKVSEDNVTFTITNSGNRDGAEIAQVYVSAKNNKIYRPKKELKGFTKVFLKAGESRIINIPLDDKAFRYFNVVTDRFEIETCNYEVMVGVNVSDIRLSDMIRVEGTDAPNPYETKRIPCYAAGIITKVPDEEFQTILGYDIPDGRWKNLLDKNDAICQMQYAKSRIARFICNIIAGMIKKSEAKGIPDLNLLFIYNMPFRAIGKMAGGMVSQNMVEGIVMIVNGRFFKGAGIVISGFFAQLKVRSKAKKMN